MLSRITLYVFASLLLVSSPVVADTLSIGMQQGLLPGFSSSWPGNPPAPPATAQHNLAWGCGAPTDPAGGSNCVLIPAGKTIASAYGTITVKQPAGIEILVRLVCGFGDGINYATVWSNEHLVGTIIMPPLPLWLDPTNANLQTPPGVAWNRGCWTEWQGINRNATYTGDGNAFEIQWTLIAK